MAPAAIAELRVVTPRRRRNLRIELWNDEAEHAAAVRGAQRAGMTLSAYLRWLVAQDEARASVPTVSPHTFTSDRAKRTD